MPPFLIIVGGILTYVGIKWYHTVAIKKGFSSFSKNKTETIKRFPPNKIFDSSTDTDDINYSEITVQQDFTVASISLAFATASMLFSSPLGKLVSVFGTSYTTTPIWQNSYNSLFKDNRFNLVVIDSIAVGGLLITGHYFLAAMLNWLFYSGKKLLFQIKDTFQKSIIYFFALRELPKSAWLLKDGTEIEVLVDTLAVGDIVVVNVGGIIPVDGTIVEGTALIDQSFLFESYQPLEKQVKAGDQVFASTVVLSGKICVQVEKWGKDTFVNKMAEKYV